MKVGFITQLLWSRYGEFWQRVATEAEYEPMFPSEEGTIDMLNHPDVQEIRSVSFRIAAAQALSMSEEAGLIVVPDVSLGVREPRGAGEDAWVSAFPERLRIAFPELPTLVSAPTSLGAVAEPAVLQFLQDGLYEPVAVKQSWSRLRGPLYETREGHGDPFVKPANAPQYVGLIGQPWLLNADVVALVEQRFGNTLSQSVLVPERLREEGERALDKPLLPTDTEVIGAARLFARRASVGSIVMVVDPLSSTDAWLANRVEKLIGSRLQVIQITELVSPEHAFDMLYNAS